MLINKNQASKELGVTRQYINKLKNMIPRPTYFVEVKERLRENGIIYEPGLYIDNEHHEWKFLIKKRENKSKPKAQVKNNELLKLIQATEKVLIDEFGEKKAENIKTRIIQELKQ